MSREMSREMNQRRAVSLLVLFGSILFMVVAWNYQAPDETRWRRPVE